MRGGSNANSARDREIRTLGGKKVEIIECSKVRDEAMENCPICHVDIKLKVDVWGMAPCHHRTHFACIRQWLERATEIPRCHMCNRQIEYLYRSSMEAPALRSGLNNSNGTPREAQPREVQPREVQQSNEDFLSEFGSIDPRGRPLTQSMDPISLSHTSEHVRSRSSAIMNDEPPRRETTMDEEEFRRTPEEEKEEEEMLKRWWS